MFHLIINRTLALYNGVLFLEFWTAICTSSSMKETISEKKKKQQYKEMQKIL